MNIYNKPKIEADPNSTEVIEDSTPVLFKVVDEIGPHQISLYIGNGEGAECSELLMREGITQSLNIGINIFPLPLTLPDGIELRRMQIGMIDAEGNDPHMLMAAVLALHAAIETYMPGKPHYPVHKNGNILVHCRGDRSRSLTVIALYLHLRQPERFSTLKSSIEHVRSCRGCGSEHPAPGMWALAEQVLLDLPSKLFKWRK